MTVIENIEASALAQESGLRSAREKAAALIAEFGLSGKAEELASSLSYGDKRRVEMARALARTLPFSCSTSLRRA